MHPVETGVCCDHTSPTGECGQWGCRYTHVGLLSDRGAPGGKGNEAEAEEEAIRDEKEEEAEGEGKDEEATEGDAGDEGAASNSSSATTTSLSSSLSSPPPSSPLSSPRSCHYQSSSTASRHMNGAIGPILQVCFASSFPVSLFPSPSVKVVLCFPVTSTHLPSLPPSPPLS